MTSILRSCIQTLYIHCVQMKWRSGASQSSLGNDMMALDIFSMKILMFYLLIFCCCDAVTTKKKYDASKKKRNSRSAYEPVTYVKQMLLKRTTVATDTINIISNSTKFRCSWITYILKTDEYIRHPNVILSRYDSIFTLAQRWNVLVYAFQ